MQLLGMRRAVNVDDRLVVHADGIEHERVALVMVDHIRRPGFHFAWIAIGSHSDRGGIGDSTAEILGSAARARDDGERS
jgi:hypothetical protein